MLPTQSLMLILLTLSSSSYTKLDELTLLSLVMTKLENTSRTSIAISFLVMNLAAGLRQLLSLFLCLFSLRTTQISRFITSSYVRASV